MWLAPWPTLVVSWRVLCFSGPYQCYLPNRTSGSDNGACAGATPSGKVGMSLPSESKGLTPEHHDVARWIAHRVPRACVSAACRTQRPASATGTKAALRPEAATRGAPSSATSGGRCGAARATRSSARPSSTCSTYVASSLPCTALRSQTASLSRRQSPPRRAPNPCLMVSVCRSPTWETEWQSASWRLTIGRW